jgi:hypothetical protein
MEMDVRAVPLQVRIRHALDVGRLPPLDGLNVSGGCGNATVCACCESDIGYGEIRLTLSGGGEGTSLITL